MEIPANLRYTKSHEWAEWDGESVKVGITAYAQDALGDIVFVELPEVGRQVIVEDELGVVESVKTASDLYAPVDGEIIAVNIALDTQPELVNTSPYGEGWIARVKVSGPEVLDALMSADEYKALLHK